MCWRIKGFESTSISMALQWHLNNIYYSIYFNNQASYSVKHRKAWVAAWEVIRGVCCGEIVCQNWFFIVFPLASFSVVAFANTIWSRSICWLLLWSVLFWLYRTAMESSSMEPLLGLVSVGTREKVLMMFAVYRPSSSYYYNSCRLHRLSHHSSICMWGWYKVH